MNLPIDLIPGSVPPRFRWRQTVSTPVGMKTVEHEGVLPPSLECAVMDLVGIAKQLDKDNVELRAIVDKAANSTLPPSASQEQASKKPVPSPVIPVKK